MDDEDQEFLMNHIGSETKKAYSSGWLQFCDFCRRKGVNTVTASAEFIVKFIRHLCVTRLSQTVMINESLGEKGFLTLNIPSYKTAFLLCFLKHIKVLPVPLQTDQHSPLYSS